MHRTRLTELLRSGAVIPSLQGTTVDEVATEMVDSLVSAELLAPAHREAAIIAILKRESIASTGLGSEVAIPHAKVRFVQDFVAALGISPDGVDFGATDGLPVRAVFLLFSPMDDPYGHLWLLGTVAGMIHQPRFLDLLAKGGTREQILERLSGAEERLHED
jgi:PTS system nitrogen regulatory IIA component